MNDIKLLPLPEPLPRVLVHVLHEGDMELEAVGNYYAAEQVRACVAHATAAKDAEIEALRADVETATRMHAITRGHLETAEARAERLAEALRLVETSKDRGFGIDYAQGVAQSALRDHGQEGKDG